MIYFAAVDSGRLLKIGFTAQPIRNRMVQHEQGAFPGIELIATMPGTRADEADILRRFRRLQAGRREVFRPEREIMEWISANATPAAESRFQPKRPARGDISTRFPAAAKLDEIIRTQFADNRCAFAAEAGICRVLLHKVLTGKRTSPVTVDFALAVQRATGGAVRVEDFAPAHTS